MMSPRALGSPKRSFVIPQDLPPTGDDRGVLLLSLKDLFDQIRNLGKENFSLECSYFEVYNESIYDLLNEE